MRRRWQEAETGVIVTNHHQFFADLKLRARGGYLFPLASAIVLDEAHAALDAARDVFGSSVSPAALAAPFRVALRHGGRAIEPYKGILPRVEAYEALLDRAVDWEGGGEEATRFTVRPNDALMRATARRRSARRGRAC